MTESNQTMSSIGNRLRELRFRKGWSQLELSQRAGIDHVMVSRYENGKTRRIGHKNLRKLGSALGVSLEEITDYNGIPESDKPSTPQFDKINESIQRLQRLSFTIQELTQQLREEQDKVAGLVQAVLYPVETSPSGGDPPLIVGDLTINHGVRRVMIKGKEIKLTSTEYNLLYLLARNVGRMLTHEFLLSRVWGEHAKPNYLKAYIQRVRNKIEGDPKNPEIILTGRGGYILARQLSPS